MFHSSRNNVVAKLQNNFHLTKKKSHPVSLQAENMSAGTLKSPVYLPNYEKNKHASRCIFNQINYVEFHPVLFLHLSVGSPSRARGWRKSCRLMELRMYGLFRVIFVQ